MKSDRTFWFGPKRAGIGYGPKTWQGWAAIGVYAVLMLVLPRAFGESGNHAARIASMVALTIAFLLLFFWKLDTSKR